MEIIYSIINTIGIFIGAGIILSIFFVILAIMLETRIIGLILCFLFFTILFYSWQFIKEEYIQDPKQSEYSYVFTELETSAEDYPGSKCLVQIQNSEKNQTIEPALNEKIYISKECHELKEKIQSFSKELSSYKIVKKESKYPELKTNSSQNDHSKIISTLNEENIHNFILLMNQFPFHSFDENDDNDPRYTELKSLVLSSEYEKFKNEIKSNHQIAFENDIIQKVVQYRIYKIKENKLYQAKFKTITLNSKNEIIKESKWIATLKIKNKLPLNTKSNQYLIEPVTFKILKYDIKNISH